MQSVQSVAEREEQSPPVLRLASAAGMLRGALVLHLPPRRRVDAMSDVIDDADVSDAMIENFVSELRTLGGMAVIA